MQNFELDFNKNANLVEFTLHKKNLTLNFLLWFLYQREYINSMK